MAHIHTQPGQHDLTASAFVVRTDTPEPTIMLHMHRKLNKYMHYGGHVELDENPWQTIEHEIEEESGYNIYDLRILQPKIRMTDMPRLDLHPMPIYVITVPYDESTDHFHTDICFALVADTPPAKSPAEGETQEHVLFTYDELEKLPDSQIFEDLKRPAMSILKQFMSEWEQVSTNQFKSRFGSMYDA